MKHITKRLVVAGTLGVALMATSFAGTSYAADTSNITVTVDSTISLAVSGDVSMSVIPTSGGATATGAHNVTVNTNNPNGYALSLASNTADSNLTKGSDVIAPTTGTQGAPIALTANTWGYRLGSFAAGTYAGVPATASPNTLKTTSAVATNDVTQVTYGVNVTTARPSGDYTNSVIYTAVTN